MRSAADVERELAAVRHERKEFYRPRTEPLDPETPGLFDLDVHDSTGEVARLLDREAHLVLELAEVKRTAGIPSQPGDQEQVDAAKRIIDRIKASRVE